MKKLTASQNVFEASGIGVGVPKQKHKVIDHKIILEKSVTLERYITGMKGTDLTKVYLCGEDLLEHRMLISINDLPGWIKSKAKFKIKMSNEDYQLVRNYFIKNKRCAKVSEDKYPLIYKKI